MSLVFQKISLDRQRDYRSCLARCPQKASDVSFVNLWGWADEYGLEWAWSGDMVWIRQTAPAVQYWPPVGDWEHADWAMLFQSRIPAPARFVRVPALLRRIWHRRDLAITVEESRGDWDYLYDRKELVELKGKRFHRKKNLINRFRKHYEYDYVNFTEAVIRQVLDMQQDWCTWRDCESIESLSAENRVIPRILRAWDKLEGMTGGAILIDGKPAAYAIGETLDEETLLIHFEKGDTGVDGIYQAVNQLFLEKAEDTVRWVNRMQDLGDEGLRKAKLSYRPVDFIEKFGVRRH